MHARLCTATNFVVELFYRKTICDVEFANSYFQQVKRSYKISKMSSLTSFVSTALKTWVPQVTAVRFRYWANKPRTVRRYGYNDPIDQKGTLAHTGGDNVVTQQPIYRPKDAWTERKALFGTNDYIDILGDEPIKITKVMYNVPMWLRGVKGTEYHVLLRKRLMLKHGVYPIARPSKWKELDKRIKWLYKYMNRKTKTFYSSQ